MKGDNKERETILKQVLSELHKEQSKLLKDTGDSFLIAQDDQFLGKIIPDEHNSESILNEQGTYGSKYSPTSIFNKQSLYGSNDGAYSANNPHCETPPKLYIKEQFVGHVTLNKHVKNQIPTDIFLDLLKNDFDALLNKKS